MISMPLMMENPVSSPMVPPIRLSWASVLIFLSLSMSSKVAVSKKICTSSRLDVTPTPTYNVIHRESKVAKQDIGGRIYQMNLNFFFENNYVNGTLFVTQNHVDWV